MKYNFKLEPLPHQTECLKKSINATAFALLMDMGTGKTKVFLDTGGIQFMHNTLNGILIIAPNSMYKNYKTKGPKKPGEIPKHMSDDIEYRLATWEPSLTKLVKEEINGIMQPEEGKLDILLMSIDSIMTDVGEAVAEEFIKNHKVLMGVDESTLIKNPDAARTKRCWKLGRKCKMRRILSGFPQPKSPEDLFAQFYFLDPAILGHASIGSFKGEFCIVEKRNNPAFRDINRKTLARFKGLNDQRMREGKAQLDMEDMNKELRRNRQKTLYLRQYTEVTGFKNLDKLNALIEPHSYRILFSDVEDVPVSYVYREIGMTKDQKKAYKQMLEECRVEIGESEITADITLVKYLRAHQIECGFTPLEDGTIHYFKERNGFTKRTNEMMAAIKETSGKVTIWASHQPCQDEVVKALMAEYGQDSVVTYTGRTTDLVGNLAAFEDPDSAVRFIVGHPMCGGRGIDMFQGTTVIFHSQPFDLELREQSERRPLRIGQKCGVLYIDLLVRGGVDEIIVTSMVDKKHLSDVVLGDNPKKWLELTEVV